MKEAILYRYQSSDEGTLGVIVCEDFWVFTLELPWRNNKPNISCIPAGEYEVTRRYSPSFRKITYWVKDVPNRSYILIHNAAFAGDTELGYQSHLQGCIALGMVTARAKNAFGKPQLCLGRSAEAVYQLEDFMEGEDFKLIVKDLYGNNTN